MIKYELRCAAEHGFEAWFRNSAAFEEQTADGSLACPVCGDGAIAKAPMAPAVAKPSSIMPVNPMQVLRAIRREVEQKCEHVGPRFAEEARRIHDGDAPERPIYGDATPSEIKTLADDGIETTRIPWIPATDS